MIICINVLYVGYLFSKAINFVDFGTSTLFVSLKIIGNSIVTWIAD